jgi:hypothetical protein
MIMQHPEIVAARFLKQCGSEGRSSLSLYHEYKSHVIGEAGYDQSSLLTFVQFKEILRGNRSIYASSCGRVICMKGINTRIVISERGGDTSDPLTSSCIILAHVNECTTATQVTDGHTHIYSVDCVNEEYVHLLDLAISAKSEDIENVLDRIASIIDTVPLLKSS